MLTGRSSGSVRETDTLGFGVIRNRFDQTTEPRCPVGRERFYKSDALCIVLGYRRARVLCPGYNDLGNVVIRVIVHVVWRIQN